MRQRILHPAILHPFSQLLFTIQINALPFFSVTHERIYSNKMNVATSTHNTLFLIDNYLKIIIRREDGYIDATELCGAVSKQWNHYYSNAKTKDFLNELSKIEKIPITVFAPGNNRALIEIGKNRHVHTWVHPQVSRLILRINEYRRKSCLIKK